MDYVRKQVTFKNKHAPPDTRANMGTLHLRDNDIEHSILQAILNIIPEILLTDNAISKTSAQKEVQPHIYRFNKQLE